MSLKQVAHSYVPALDGLRTIAVYLVVFFHAGIILIGGGFIGVDLFFVLSGFLVSSLLFDELSRTGRIDLGGFFARRVRRLLPAATVVVVATAAVFALVTSTVRRLPLVGDAQAALLYVSNWRFLHQANDYFGADVVDQSPYLHFWSLSIEEQFYFGFPLLLLLLAWCARRWRRAIVLGLATLFVASLAAQVFWAGRDLNHAYYGTDARLYQLLAGVLTALFWRRIVASERPLRLPVASGWFFLALLLIGSSSLLDVTPSVRGMVATVASVGLILSVVSRTDRSLLWTLERPAMTYLGRISYGTYLWHWPVILVLLEVLEVRPLVIALLTVGLASGLAALSFEIFEHPIRTAKRLRNFRWSTLVIGVGASAMIAVTVMPSVLEVERRPALASANTTAADGHNALKDGPIPPDLDWKGFTEETGQDLAFCTLDDTESCLGHEGSEGPRVMLVGDSHSKVLAPAIRDLAEEHDFTLFYRTIGRCPWQNGVINRDSDGRTEREECEQSRQAIYGGLIEKMDIDVVILSQIERTDLLQPTDGSGLSGEELAEHSIRSSLAEINEAGAKAVVMLNALTPAATVGNPLECLSTASRRSECRVTVPEAPPITDAFYRTAAAVSDDVAAVDINPIMCPTWPVCEAIIGKTPVWRDKYHYLPSALQAKRGEIWDMLLDTGWFGDNASD